jgi:DNA invertase Pin-like site-specific DNA recombinase
VTVKITPVGNQLQELRRYVATRGWEATEFIDRGVSGARESRPALDSLVKDARRRRFDVVVVWRLDRLGRNLRHLILLLDELTALGIEFASLNEGIDTSTPAGRLQLHILGAIAEFERARIQERVRAGLARARAQGQQRLGRPRVRVAPERLQEFARLSVREAARALGLSRSTVQRRFRGGAGMTRPATPVAVSEASEEWAEWAEWVPAEDGWRC